MREPYIQLEAAASKDLKSDETRDRIGDLVSVSLDFLMSGCAPVDFVSCVARKAYFSYALKSRDELLSRPVHRELFIPDRKAVARLWKAWAAGKATTAPLGYTVGTAYRIASDLFDRNNKKGPATLTPSFSERS